ncbi:MAG: PIG-L family deacetylase [Ktedonobacteraceae bacterium]|nr:PIG-L family deacetylase [Ktedonobacteraceae bacterium]
MPAKRLLGIFAHPDDEGIISGTLLHYHELEVETGLVYATRGEAGDISDLSLATPANLGTVREQEARAAAQILGVDHLWFLDYRDSGMAGTAHNQDPHALINARSVDVIAQLVKIIREFKPQVIITFDETGIYRHPDHIAIYKHTTAAFHAAADTILFPYLGEGHAAAKLYYTSFSRRHLLTMADWFETESYDSVLKGLDVEHLGLADQQISVVLDVERWYETKQLARQQHRTQTSPNSPQAHIPSELQRKWKGTEFFQLAASRVGDDVIGENDLFARVL